MPARIDHAITSGTFTLDGDILNGALRQSISGY